MREKIRNMLQWPEFRPAWLLLMPIVLVFLIVLYDSPPLIILIEGIFSVVVIAASFSIAYRGAAAERRVVVEHNELQGMLLGTTDALIIYDEEFKIVLFNAIAERLFKISADDALGHVITPRDMQQPGWRGIAQIVFPTLASRIIYQSKENEFPQTVDLSLIEPALEVRVITAPVQDAHGKNAAFIKVIHDRTPQISAIRSNTQFITVASHQLRGPVTDIVWALETIDGDKSLSETNQQIVSNALEASKGLIRKIEDLLDVARIEEGKVGYVFEEMDVAEFVSGVLASVLPSARKAGIKIYFDRPTEPLPKVSIDPKRLEVALTNFLENAIRYNVENGEVVVRVDRVPGKPFVQISVKDTGIGVPPEAIDKLFVKFYRAENAVHSQTEGSGLGLYIAKNIITAHGGEVKMESEVNRGATVTFTLPTDPALVPKGEIGPEGFLL